MLGSDVPLPWLLLLLLFEFCRLSFPLVVLPSVWA
jgi:hypothetical protein